MDIINYKLCELCKKRYIHIQDPSVWCYLCWDTNNASVITDNLYLSNYFISKQYDRLKSLNINQILSIGKELPQHNTTEFKTLHIELEDRTDENIKQHFETAIEFINNGPTLVHCYAGISRSATIVLAYMMKTYKLPLYLAMKHCKSRRSIISPNSGFMKQLYEFEAEVVHTKQ